MEKKTSEQLRAKLGEVVRQMDHKIEEYQELERTCVDSIQRIGNTLNYIKTQKKIDSKLKDGLIKNLMGN